MTWLRDARRSPGVLRGVRTRYSGVIFPRDLPRKGTTTAEGGRTSDSPPHRKKSSSASGSVAAYLIAILLMTGSICAEITEVEILPHVLAGGFSYDAGEFQCVTEIQIVLAEYKPWHGDMLIMLPGVFDVHVDNAEGTVVGGRYPAQRGESRIPISIYQYTETRVIQISSGDRLLVGSVVIDGPDGAVLAISAGYRIVNAVTGKLSDAVSVPVVAGGTAYDRGHHKRVIVPVHLRPGQSLGVSYMLEKSSKFAPATEVDILATASLYIGGEALPLPRSILKATVPYKAFYQHAGAWSLNQYWPELNKEGATGTLELRVTGDYRYIRATAFVYERGDDGALRYTTVEVKHLREE